MDPALAPNLLKLAVPCVLTGIMTLVVRRRGVTGSDQVGLVRPRAKDLVAWVGIWAAWVAVTEVATRLLHVEGARPWVGFSPLVIAIRVLAIGVAGPVAEEIAFRGIVLWRLRSTRLGAAGGIVVSSAIWALLHFQYEPLLLAQVALDGLFLGTARQRTGSLGAPIVMHVLGNLFSIGQSILGVG